MLADVNATALPYKSKGITKGFHLSPACLNVVCVPEYCVGYIFRTISSFWGDIDGDLPKNTNKTRLSLVEPE